VNEFSLTPIPLQNAAGTRAGGLMTPMPEIGLLVVTTSRLSPAGCHNQPTGPGTAALLEVLEGTVVLRGPGRGRMPSLLPFRADP